MCVCICTVCMHCVCVCMDVYIPFNGKVKVNTHRTKFLD